MRWHLVALTVTLVLPACMATPVMAENLWVGGNGVPLNIWDEPSNWDSGVVPQSAVDKDINAVGDELNVTRFKTDGTNTLIDSSVDATAFAVQLGHPKDGTLGAQSASNTLTMTGGTLTSQGNFLINVGRGRNPDSNPGHLVQFNVSGGVVNAAGITVPEAFNPDNVLGFTSGGLNAEMHVSGDAIVNTDLLRLGAFDANSTVTVSDNARINLTDDNNGFANGQLWLESFEDLDNPRGVSVLDISGNGVVRIHGGVNNIQDDQVASLAIITDELIPRGMITANGGADPVVAVLRGNVISLAANANAIPEPASLGLGLLAICPLLLARRRR